MDQQKLNCMDVFLWKREQQSLERDKDTKRGKKKKGKKEKRKSFSEKYQHNDGIIHVSYLSSTNSLTHFPWINDALRRKQWQTLRDKYPCVNCTMYISKSIKLEIGDYYGNQRKYNFAEDDGKPMTTNGTYTHTNTHRSP